MQREPSEIGAQIDDVERDGSNQEKSHQGSDADKSTCQRPKVASTQSDQHQVDGHHGHRDPTEKDHLGDPSIPIPPLRFGEPPAEHIEPDVEIELFVDSQQDENDRDCDPDPARSPGLVISPTHHRRPIAQGGDREIAQKDAPAENREVAHSFGCRYHIRSRSRGRISAL